MVGIEQDEVGSMENDWYKIFPLQILSHVDRIPDATLHGDFLLLAMYCLQRGGLPNDNEEISWLTRLSPERVAQLRPYLNRLAEVRDDKLMIRFIGDIIQERQEYAERRASAGRQGGRPPKPDPIEEGDFPPPPDGNGLDSPGKTKTKDLAAVKAETGEKQCFSSENNVYQFKAEESQYIHTDIHTNKNTSPSEKQRNPSRKSPEPKPKREPNPQLAYFDEKYLALYGIPCAHAKKDFVQLAHLRSECAGAKPDPWELTDERWRRAVDNYFASSLGSHTLADLCVRFGAFYRNALDRFGKPVAATSAAANGGIEPKRQVVV